MNKCKYILALFCILFVFSTGVNATTGPTDQLRPTLDSLVTILADPNLKGDKNKLDRRQKIMTTIGKRFDFREMTRRVVGKTWRNISEDDRKYVTKQMTKLLENNYIGQLENYSGQTVEYVGEKIKTEKNRSKALVSTIISGQAAKYPVHYIMVKKKTNWFVYDINIEGVSLIRNYQQEFKSIIRKDKFEGLIKALEKKNKSFEKN